MLDQNDSTLFTRVMDYNEPYDESILDLGLFTCQGIDDIGNGAMVPGPYEVCIPQADGAISRPLHPSGKQTSNMRKQKEDSNDLPCPASQVDVADAAVVVGPAQIASGSKPSPSAKHDLRDEEDAVWRIESLITKQKRQGSIESAAIRAGNSAGHKLRPN